MQPRLFYNDAHGWLIETAFPMTLQMLDACVAFSRKVQQQRISNMPPGNRRDRAIKALSSLCAKNIQQKLLPKNPWEKEVTAFVADAGYEKNKIYIGT